MILRKLVLFSLESLYFRGIIIILGMIQASSNPPHHPASSYRARTKKRSANLFLTQSFRQATQTLAGSADLLRVSALFSGRSGYVLHIGKEKVGQGQGHHLQALRGMEKRRPGKCTSWFLHLDAPGRDNIGWQTQFL